MFKPHSLIDNFNAGEKNRDWENPSDENGTASGIEEKRDAQICNDLRDLLSLVPPGRIRENASVIVHPTDQLPGERVLVCSANTSSPGTRFLPPRLDECLESLQVPFPSLRTHHLFFRPYLEAHSRYEGYRDTKDIE